MPDNRPFDAPSRRPTPSELYAEFYVERTKKFYRIELRDHGKYGVEAQILDPVDPIICRMFRPELDPTRTPRAMAIAWAEEERKSLESR